MKKSVHCNGRKIAAGADIDRQDSPRSLAFTVLFVSDSIDFNRRATTIRANNSLGKQSARTQKNGHP